MGKFTGILKQPIIDFQSGRLTLLFEPNEDFRETYEELKDCEKLSLEIKKYRASRSLNANAYFHVLVGKLADVLLVSKPAMKNRMLCKYGQLEYDNDKLVTFIVDDELDVSEYEHIHLRPTSKTKTLDNGRLYRVYLVVRGSHTYDSKEMAKLIEGTISDCKDAYIPDAEIATPDERRILKERYGIDV